MKNKKLINSFKCAIQGIIQAYNYNDTSYNSRDSFKNKYTRMDNMYNIIWLGYFIGISKFGNRSNCRYCNARNK